MKRRDYLNGLAAFGGLTATGGVQAGEGQEVERLSYAGLTDGEGYHPGPPRFVQVGELLMDPVFVDAGHGFDRDNLAPALPPAKDADNYGPDAFDWSVTSRPAGSEADVEYAPSPYDDREQHDPGRHNHAEFAPDEPGTYVLGLDAPDGSHEVTIRAFPESPKSAGGPPRVELDGHYDEASAEFVLESNPRLAPDSGASMADLDVEFLPHDDSSLSRDDITVDETTARVPASALDGDTEVYAAAYDGQVHSTTDEAVLDPESGEVRLSNRPPEWLDDAVIYEIFTRSFGGGYGETDFDFLASKADYLGELGVDVVWLTPIVPAWSARIEAETDEFAPGGPHAYSASSYFDVAPDLGTLAAFDRFVEACHENGVKVCFDFVINHCGWEHPFFQDAIAETGPEPENHWEFPRITEWNTESKYFDWFDRMDVGAYEAGPAQTSFFGVRLQPNLDYGNLALRQHILAAADFWSDRVDAFRCDIAWGVPHSFWKEVRGLVKARDTEFMLLDETIPNDPSFAESEFDAHFDTVDFMRTAHEVAKGAADPQELVTAVQKRKREGFPDHTHVVNSTENHDEPRLHWEARENGTREDAAKAQRAAVAAAFTLPGVPFLYYGQERLVSEHGHRRTSPFEGDPNLSDDIEQHPYKRAFMNWAENGDTVPEDHQAFYEDLIAFYHESEACSARGEVVQAYSRTEADSDLLAFGLDTDAGKRVVLVNFGPDPVEVQLRSTVSTTERFTGRDVGVERDADGTHVEVDTLAVLETPSLFGLGERVTALDEPTGDDHGPGSYTYPTGDDYAAGAFDLSGFAVHQTADDVQFVFEVAGDLTNPRGYDGGFSVQHLQVYLHDPDASRGTTTAREGVGASFDDSYHYRVVVDGRHGTRVETADGREVASGEVRTTPGGSVVAEVPKSALGDGDFGALKAAPLMMGFNPAAPGGVVPVEESAGEDAFGGAGGSDAPSVVDLVTPADVEQGQALAYGDGSTATIPFVPLRTAFETVAEWEDPVGDDHGPDTYTYPTGDAYYDGAYDMVGLAIRRSRDRIRFEVTMREPVANPWGLPRGFSHQFFQLYVHDPAAGDAPATRKGRIGLSTNFRRPYHYRILVNGESEAQVERPAPDGEGGEVVSSDVQVRVDGERTIQFDVPADAIDAPIERTYVAPVLAPYDGYGDGHVRPLAADSGEHVVGGATTDGIDPKVMDTITPASFSQSEALGSSGSARARIPYLAVGGEREPPEGTPTPTPVATVPGGGDDPTSTVTATETGSPVPTGTTSPGLGLLSGAAATGGGALLALRRLLGPDDE